MFTNNSSCKHVISNNSSFCCCFFFHLRCTSIQKYFSLIVTKVQGFAWFSLESLSFPGGTIQFLATGNEVTCSRIQQTVLAGVWTRGIWGSPGGYYTNRFTRLLKGVISLCCYVADTCTHYKWRRTWPQVYWRVARTQWPCWPPILLKVYCVLLVLL